METTCAVIGGSNAFRFLEERKTQVEARGCIETAFGASSPLFLVRTAESTFYFLSRHGERGYDIAAPFVNYRANIYALKDRGVQNIIAWSGPGAIDESLTVGSLVIPDDIIDETKRRKSTFFDNAGGIGFIRQNPVFCPELAKLLSNTLDNLGLKHCTSGTYVCTEGPRLETPAEIRKYKLCGGHLVGMTLAPECFLARELEICYIPICYVTNIAEGVRHREYSKGELFEGLLTPGEKKKFSEAIAALPSIITAFSSKASHRERECPCSRSMERYRRTGVISEDWHTWFGKPSDS